MFQQTFYQLAFYRFSFLFYFAFSLVRIPIENENENRFPFPMPGTVHKSCHSFRYPIFSIWDDASKSFCLKRLHCVVIVSLKNTKASRFKPDNYPFSPIHIYERSPNRRHFSPFAKIEIREMLSKCFVISPRGVIRTQINLIRILYGYEILKETGVREREVRGGRGFRRSIKLYDVNFDRFMVLRLARLSSN